MEELAMRVLSMVRDAVDPNSLRRDDDTMSMRSYSSYVSHVHRMGGKGGPGAMPGAGPIGGGSAGLGYGSSSLYDYNDRPHGLPAYHADDYELPPGRLFDGQPDMTDTVNQEWYEVREIFPEDDAWGQPLLKPEEERVRPETDEPESQQPDPGLETELATEGTSVVDSAAAAAAAKSVAAAQQQQPPPPRPCHPLVSFGPGGRLVVMFPKADPSQQQPSPLSSSD
eukprot:UC1_evm1s923